MQLGFVTAMADEARTLDGAFADTTPAAHRPRVTVAGVGPVNADAAAERLLARGVDTLVSWGTAGGLNPVMRAGDLLIYDETIDESGQIFRCSPQWHRRLATALTALDAYTGSGCTLAQPAASAAAKSTLYARTRCMAVDMESAAIGAAARRAGAAYLAVRAIVDPANFTIPRAALNGINYDGTTRPWGVIASLARRPGELPRLLRLARWHHLALNRLREAARLLQPAFGLNGPGGDRNGDA